METWELSLQTLQNIHFQNWFNIGFYPGKLDETLVLLTQLSLQTLVFKLSTLMFIIVFIAF